MESQLRSGSSWSRRPRLSNGFCSEVCSGVIAEKTPTPGGGGSTSSTAPSSPLTSPSRSPEPADGFKYSTCTWTPATWGVSPDPQKINVNLVNGTPADVNELRWLLATIEGLEGASLFTRMIEKRNIKDFHIVALSSDTLPPPIPPHAFRITDPWTTGWKWLAALPHSAEIMAAYLAAVGLTWAPVPVMVEASWLYELSVYGCSRFFDSDKMLLTLDASSLNKDSFITDCMSRGFVECFLYDIVAFWRGINFTLSHHEAITANGEYSTLAALELKRLASSYCGNRWIAGEVPIASLVKAAWDTSEWRRSWIPYVPNDLTVVLPSRVSTVVFKLDTALGEAEKLREQMFVNGYTSCPLRGDDQHFKLGVTSAGMFVADFNFYLVDLHSRQKSAWIFDVDRGFTVAANNLSVLFMAAHGANIKATYDESFARMFTGPYPFGAVSEWPRSCFARCDPDRQHQIVFEIDNAEDPRGRGVFEILSVLNRMGGLLHLSCESVRSVLAPSCHPANVIPRLTRSAVGRSRVQSRGEVHTIGRIFCDKISPGLYAGEDLPTNSTPADLTKVRFCRYFLRDHEEIEVCTTDRNAPRYKPDTDSAPVILCNGITYTVLEITNPPRQHRSTPRGTNSIPTT